MVLKIVGAAFNAFFPTQYTTHIVLGIVTVLVLRAFSQGRTTNRERDLHARKIIVTGGFTPLGLTLLQSLAQRGAHIIALSPDPIDSPKVTIPITLLRTTFSNEQIYAEHCDLASPSSIHAFSTRFLTGSDQRIDAIIYAHEYSHIGAVRPFSRTQSDEAANKRDAASLSTFLMTTLLLPALLVAPVERDIRLITLINPFYAAATATSSSSALAFASPTTTATTTTTIGTTSLFLKEGTRALRTAILTRHLQRILDALPTAAQVPKTDTASSSTVPIVSPAAQKSNIVAVSVSPGISRADTIAPLLNADWTVASSGFSYLGVILYLLLLQPLLWILTKSPAVAVQTVLHALFLPTPFKVLAGSSGSKKSFSADEKGGGTARTTTLVDPEEVLKPGALYAECAVVRVDVPAVFVAEDMMGGGRSGKGEGKENGSGNVNVKEEVLDVLDDGEFGGEAMGRAVWEAYEEALKAWEKANPPPKEDVAGPDAS